jgi:glutathione S-transferase
MAQIIFHHYPQSPVSEKVRLAFGLKNLAWASVEIPRLPPKPDLMPLTGGYRRTPVMQIGADIYCDSQEILRELQRRFPQPSFFPGGADGLVWGVSRWTDGDFFSQSVGLVLGAAGDKLPADFAADRGRLYFGPDYDIQAIGADLAHITAQLRGQFGWIEERLATGRAFMLGEAPGLPDVLAYYLVWFIRGRWDKGAELLSEFSCLEAWEERVKSIGHGEASEMDSKAALEIARAATSTTAEAADARDPQGLAPGMAVGVTPAADGGDPVVSGVVRAVSRDSISILRHDAQVGEVCVHFPRVGYRVTRDA